MAERRMFAKTIIDSDVFLDMPLSSQALYFHLSMRADDEGFVNNPKKIQRMIGASDDDFKVLLSKNFVIGFESGVIVIKHWKIHNYIRNDRLNETKYKEERALLSVKENGSYTLNNDLLRIAIDCDADIIDEKTIDAYDNLSATDKRKLAYQESSLPYSFTYKMKRAFEGKSCPICGKTMTSFYKLNMPTIQHNLPISKGGKHELDNISIICESCNTSIRDKETDSFNNIEVIEIWDKIVYAENHGIKWFDNPKVLEKISLSSCDGQMSVKCPSTVSIGKDSIGKVSIEKDSNNILSSSQDNSTPPYDEIINYLNEKTGQHYKSTTEATRKSINGRLKEGYTVDDFKKVIDIKTSQWLKDKEMSMYLRPSTLFSPSKFESYLNEATKNQPASKYDDLSERIRRSNDEQFNGNADTTGFR